MDFPYWFPNRYDSRGNRIRETNGFHQVVEDLTYNLQDQPVKRQDGMDSQREYAYTLDEHIREIRRGHGGKQQILQSYEYNARGQIIGITDGVGAKVDYDVDSWGRIIGVGFSDGVKEGYSAIWKPGWEKRSYSLLRMNMTGTETGLKKKIHKARPAITTMRRIS